MARTARKPKDDDGGEIKVKDFGKAVGLYRNDIKRANSEAATQNQTAGQGYKEIKKVCHIQPDAARKAFKLMDATEEAKRDDWFRGFVGLVNEMAGHTVLTFNDTDLVSQMQVDDGYKRPPISLVEVPKSDGSETDLADAAEFTEATKEELAQQEGRAPAAGTGSAAIAAMKEAAAKESAEG